MTRGIRQREQAPRTKRFATFGCRSARLCLLLFAAAALFEFRYSGFFRISTFGFRISAGSPRSSPCAVAEQIPEKEEIVFEIARTQPARFRPKAEDPGQPQPLHPFRGVGFHARIDIKSEAHG